MSNQTTYSDQELLELLRSPEPGKQDLAFKYLYQNSYKVVRALVTRNSGNESETVDVFQDTMIVLFNNARTPGFKLTGKLSSYIYGVARIVWLKKLRKHKPQFEIDDAKIQLKETNPSGLEILEKEEKFNHLESLISKLHKDCIRVLKYFYYEKMSMKEISKEMNYASENVAKNKKLSCLKKLRESALSNPELLK